MSDKVETDKAIGTEVTGKDVDSESYTSSDESSDVIPEEEQEFNSKRVVTNIAKFICTTEVSPFMVQSFSLKTLVRRHNPQFQVDSSTVLTECLSKRR